MTLNSLRKYSHNRGPRSQRCCVGRPCPGDCALLLAWSERVHCFRSRQNSSQRLQRHDISDPSLHRESMDTILNKQCVWKGGLTATVRTALSRTRRSVCASRSCLFRGLRPHEGTRNLANPPGVQEQKSLVSLAWLPQFASLWQHRPAQSLANPSGAGVAGVSAEFVAPQETARVRRTQRRRQQRKPRLYAWETGLPPPNGPRYRWGGDHVRLWTFPAFSWK